MYKKQKKNNNNNNNKEGEELEENELKLFEQKFIV